MNRDNLIRMRLADLKSPAMNLRAVLRQAPDPRGKQGQDYRPWSIPGLILVSLLCGRRGLRAAFFLRRGLNKRQRSALGFMNGETPCHTTLTETVRAIDGRALAARVGGRVSIILYCE
jgi:hypothetical protein